MNLHRDDDQRSGRIKAVLDRVHELKEAFNQASSDSERTRLLNEMQKLNQSIHTIMMDDIGDYDDYEDYDNDSDLLDAYEDDLIDYYDGGEDVDSELDADEFLF
jgi:hypothetical protein